MKISRDALAYRKKINFRNVKSAVDDALTPNSYSYEGQLEKLQTEIGLLRDFIARLVEQLPLDKDQLKAVLGYGYEVED